MKIGLVTAKLSHMLNCVLIGYGYWGPNIARSIAKIGDVKLVAIIDQDQEKIDQANKDFPQVYVTKETNQVLKDPTVDAVIVATPASTHFQIAVAALKSGKNILIEKPVTTNSKQVQKLIELNKIARKIIMVGHTFEYNPAVIKMKEIMNDQSFGKIYYAYSTRVNLGQVRGDINALWNLAPHDVSILNFLLDAEPIEVMASGACLLQENIEDVVFLVLKYPNNVLTEVHVSWLDPAKERRMTIVGSKKMMVFDDLDNEMPLKIYDKKVDITDVAKGLGSVFKVRLHSGDIYSPQIENKEPLLEELRHFFECIENQKQPLTDLVNGLLVVKVLQACQKSLQNHNKWIKV